MISGIKMLQSTAHAVCQLRVLNSNILGILDETAASPVFLACLMPN
jgi:hypothetical protein